MPAWSVRRLAAVDEKLIDELATVLIDCVEGGATVGFMVPITRIGRCRSGVALPKALQRVSGCC